MDEWASYREANESVFKALKEAKIPFNEIWVRPGFLCDYCGCDLAENAAIHRGVEGDHILPQYRYPKLVNSSSNYANACASCHKLKGKFAPGKDEPRYLEIDELSEDDRHSLIGKVNAELGPMRETQEVDLANLRRVIDEYGLRKRS